MAKEMAKFKISKIAEEIGRKPKEVLEKAIEMGLNVKVAQSSVTEEEANWLATYIETGVNNMPKIETPKKEPKTTEKTESKKTTKKETPIKKTEKTESKKPKKEKEEPKKAESKNDLDEQKEIQAPPKLPGIRIVKKNDQNEVKEVKKINAPQDIKTLINDKLNLESSLESKRKKKKDEKKKPITAYEHGTKIQVEREIGFQQTSQYIKDSVKMLDLNETEFIDEDKENEIRQNLTDRVRIQRKNPWMNENRSISRNRRKKSKPQNTEKKLEVQSVIKIPEEIRVYEFADIAGRSLTEVIKTLFNLGVMATKNDFLDKDAIEILAEEFKIEISIQEQETQEETQEIQGELESRPPVVTIMGHVDHGKTSLLDYIRNARIAAHEAGGITQHIGAYMVEKNGKLISFIDTPGHEAFSAMRNRGALVTDIAIIVIAADDGVKKQTIEALNQAKAANVQIIIAMNKMDKENANPDKLKAECAELGFVPNDWGGEYEFIPISAKSGEGIDLLLETILLQAEVMELKASNTASAHAIVLEGSIQKGRGPVANIIVKQGILRVGDPIYSGTAYGRVRALIDDLGNSINELKPSGVASVTGLSEIPSAGSGLFVVENDSIAREKAQKIANYLRQKELSKSTKVSFDELGEMVALGQLKNLPLIVKADTQGSLEAIKASLLALSNEEVQINIIGDGVGGINENDLTLASSGSNCIILGFGLRPTGIIKNKSKELGIEIKTYSVIYDLVDDIKALVSGLMSPIIEEENTGQAEVRETFVVGKVGVIAGCFVNEGKIMRGINIRLIRDGVVIHTGQIASLKRFKDDVKEVSKGYECGIMLENFNDIKVGDVFETFTQIKKAKTL